MRFSRGFVGAFVVSAMAVFAACGPAENASPYPETDDSSTSTRPLSGTRLRLMAGNLSSGNGQSYTPGHGARIFQGCHPDVVMIQEFNYGSNTAADFRTFVDQTFGTGFSYARGAPAQIPNGVISRYPIVASGDWVDNSVSNRAFTWAHIDLPGSHDLWAVSVHLLTTGAGNRAAETSSLVKQIQANVPAGDYVVIGGDFNTGSRTEQALSNLSAVVVTSGPYPADRNGNGNTSASRSKPYDWVVVSPNLAAQATATVIGGSTFANGLVADTRVYSPIAEISPALSNDSSAPSMQHMGIVRDFDVDFGNTPPPPTVHVDSPNGGEVFLTQTPQTIRWVASNATSVDLWYAADGTTFTAIASAVNASAGSFNWVTPAAATTTGKIRISVAGNSAVSDTSDAVFTLKAAPPPTSVHVDSPNGGEVLAAGQTVTIRWSATNVARVDVGYAVNGTTFTTVGASVDATLGQLSWVVPSTATASAKVRVIDAADSTFSDVSDSAFTVTVPTTPAKVIVNEILANEAGSDPAGEFVELVNVGGSAADLSGWALSDSAQVRHRFATGTSLAAGATLVVFGKATGIPVGLANATAASTGTLGLSNSGDTVSLFDAASASVDVFTYGASLSSTDGVSMNRSPDRTAGAGFVLHTSLSTASSSPGHSVDGTL